MYPILTNMLSTWFRISINISGIRVSLLRFILYWPACSLPDLESLETSLGLESLCWALSFIGQHALPDLESLETSLGLKSLCWDLSYIDQHALPDLESLETSLGLESLCWDFILYWTACSLPDLESLEISLGLESLCWDLSYIDQHALYLI